MVATKTPYRENLLTGSEKKPDRPPLRKGISWTFLGNVSNTVSQFVLLIALARLGNVGMVGQFGLGLAITAPMFLLANMSLRTIQVTDSDGFGFSSFANLRLRSMLLALGFVVLICMAADYSRETTWIVLLIGVTKSIDGLSDVVFGEFQKKEQMDLIARSMIVKAIVTTVAFILVLGATGSLILSLISMSVVGLARFLFFDLANLMHAVSAAHPTPFELLRAVFVFASNPFRGGRLMQLAWVSLPVGLASFLVSLNTNIPRYLIEGAFGPKELGIFTVLSYPLAAGNIVMSAVTQASLPRLHYLNERRDYRGFQRLVGRMLLLASALALVALIVSALAGKYFLRLAFGAEYAGEFPAFMILVLTMGFGFANWSLNAALQAWKAFRLLFAIQTFATVFAGATAFLMIPEYGLEGAAVSMLLTTAAQIAFKVPIIRAMLRSDT